jgi:hypothetical protein
LCSCLVEELFKLFYNKIKFSTALKSVLTTACLTLNSHYRLLFSWNIHTHSQKRPFELNMRRPLSHFRDHLRNNFFTHFFCVWLSVTPVFATIW